MRHLSSTKIFQCSIPHPVIILIAAMLYTTFSLYTIITTFRLCTTILYNHLQSLYSYPPHSNWIMLLYYDIQSHYDAILYVPHSVFIINPRRACTASITVVGFVCLCVCLLISHISPLDHLFVLKLMSRSHRAKNLVSGQHYCDKSVSYMDWLIVLPIDIIWLFTSS